MGRAVRLRFLALLFLFVYNCPDFNKNHLVFYNSGKRMLGFSNLLIMENRSLELPQTLIISEQ